MSSVSLTQDIANSSRNLKTPGKIRNEKSVGRTREPSNEKDKLVKMKTMVNLKNFSNVAKNIKNDNKIIAKNTTNNLSNKSSIFNDKDGLTSMDTTSKNKTFMLEKNELKKEKSKANLTNKEDSI